MYLSIRDAMLFEGGFTSAIEGARWLGVRDVELHLTREFQTPLLDTSETVQLLTDSDAVAYRKYLDGLGVRGSVFLTACDFSVGDQTENAGWIARSIELADAMGMAAIRIDSFMSRERDLDFGERVKLFSEGLRESLNRTRGCKVALGIENHGFQGNNLAFLLNVFNRVGSERLGSTMDTGNFYWRGYPLSEVYGILELLAPYTVHTHLKNIAYPVELREQTREAGWEYERYVCPLDEGDIDHARVLELLANAGYKGDICIENESLAKYPIEQRRTVLKREAAHVQAIIDNVSRP